MLDTATKRRIDTARDILVGKVPDPKSQVEQITIALIYKFMDDMDAEAEELGGKRTFFTGKYSKYGWRKIFDARLSGFEMLSLYSEAIQQMNLIPSIPQLFRDIFKNAYLPYRDPETLKAFLKIINEFNYDHSERLGDAFEYLLSVLGSQGDAGQFRTPRHIIDFMVRIADPKKTDRILDPACGTSGFLISSYKHILKCNTHPSPQKTHDPLSFSFGEGGRRPDEVGKGVRSKPGSALTTDDRKKLAQQLKGYDISPDMVRLSLANMYLHGFIQPSIIEYDTLTSEDRWNEYYDVIMANPPFMSPKGGIRPHKRFSVQSNRSEVLFVDYIAEHLTPNGRAAVIVPEGIIFQSGTAYKQLRKLLIENYLWAVVSLPAGVFQPYSGVKTSVLLLDKTLAKKTDSILFVKVQNDGFDLGAQRRPIDKSDLYFAEELLKHYKQHLQLENFDVAAAIKNAAAINKVDHEVNEVPVVKIEASQYLLVEKNKISASGEYGLSGDRYKENGSVSTIYPIVSLDVVCGINPEACEPSAIFKKSFLYIDISSVENETGKYSLENEMSIDEAPSRARRKVQNNDVLISTVRPNLKAFTILKNIPSNVIASTGFAVLRCNERMLPDFLFAMIKSDNAVNQMIQKMGRGAYPSINQKDVSEIQIPLPPLSIQQQIVTEIEGYQKVIDGARQVVENYKPTIRINPDWEMVELNSIAEVIMGQSPDGESYNDKGVGTPLTNGPVEFGPESFSKTIKSKFTTKPTKLCKEGDLILCVRGSTTGRMNIAGVDACIGRGVAAIRSKNYQQWINNYINLIQRNIYELGSGSTFPNVTTDTLKSLKIPLPPLEDQEEIVRQLEMERLLVDGNKQLIARMEQKIKETIAQVWGEDKSEVVYETNEAVTMAAEE